MTCPWRISILTFHAGEAFQSKLGRLREEITKKNAVASVVTLLDEVAWLFNLRGTDIDFNPGIFKHSSPI